MEVLLIFTLFLCASCELFEGMMFGDIKGKSGIFRVVSSHPTELCTNIVLKNIPKNINAIDELEFTQEPKFYNDRPAFGNQKTRQYISFVHNVDHGTWIFGDTPGVDSGSMYFRVNHETFTPLDGKYGWHFWNGNVWEHSREIEVICKNEDSLQANWGQLNYILKQEEKTKIVLTGPEDCVEGDSWPYPHRFNVLTDKGNWVELNVKKQMPFGGEFSIVQKNKEDEIFCENCIFRNIEFLHVGYRLAFFNLKTFEDFYGMTSVHGFRKHETKINLTAQQIEPKLEILKNLAPKDYCMLYTNEDDFFGQLLLIKTVEDDFFSQTFLNNNLKYIFQVWPSHRRELMEETNLHQMMSYIEVDLKTKIITQGEQKLKLLSIFTFPKDVLSYLKTHIEANEKLWDLPSCFTYHAATALPEQLVYALELACFIVGYKPMVMVQMTSDSDDQTKFPIVGDLIQALILSVDLNPNSEITYQINSYRHFETIIFSHVGCSDHMVNWLQPATEAQALHIVPFPEDDASKNIPIYKKQIQNSYFNGIILGYPERFVESYCVDLVSQEFLSLEDIQLEILQGKRLVNDFFKNDDNGVNKKTLPIGKNSCPSFYEKFSNFWNENSLQT